MEINGLPLDSAGVRYTEVVVRGTMQWEGGYTGGGLLALAEDDAKGQVAQIVKDLPEGPFELLYRVPKRDRELRNKLYFWNTTGIPFRLEGLEILVMRHRMLTERAPR